MEDAFATFVGLCYRLAPGFEDFNEEAIALGFRLSPNGWLNHKDGNMTIVLREHATHDSCQFAFSATGGDRAFVKRLETPFNANEISKENYLRLLSLPPGTLSGVRARSFLAKTNFGGKDAFLTGLILRDADSRLIDGGYSLKLQVAK